MFVRNTLLGSDSYPTSTTFGSEKEETSQVNSEIRELREKFDSSNETIAILENKLARAEAETLKTYEEKKLEITTLKNALKKSNCDTSKIKKDLENENKLVKEKEKMIKKLEQK